MLVYHGKYIKAVPHYLLLLYIFMLRRVASVETDFQRIDIYDYIDHRSGSIKLYETSLEGNITYESMNHHFFSPSREVFLDGVLQSTKHGDEAYHESLVHPGMFTHSSPERVVIVGGGEGGTLREVLKHKSVKNVMMLEIDELMSDFSRKYLPYMNDCSDSKGSSASCCFDDDRADVIFEDATAWLLDEFGDDGLGPTAKMWARHNENDDFEELLDIIIMDALDPMYVIPGFADVLYSSDDFMQVLFDALNDDGVLIIQLGQSPDVSDPDEFISIKKQRSKVIAKIAALGFQSMHVYEESHCGFSDPWSLLIACKDDLCQRNFYRNEAEVEHAFHRRIHGSYSGANPLKFFDGATMKSYQVPPKTWENVFCRQTPTPGICATIKSQSGTRFVVSNIDAVRSGEVGHAICDGAVTAAVSAEEVLLPELHFSPGNIKILCNASPEGTYLPPFVNLIADYGASVRKIGVTMGHRQFLNEVSSKLYHVS